MDQNISLKEQNNSKIQNQNKIKYKKKENNKIKNKMNLISKPQKRTRDYSPSMDIEEIQTSNNQTKINNKNKRMKVPIRKLVERLELEDKEQNKTNNNKNANKNKQSKKSKGIKIFSDMSVSEISNNLFKNYYPCKLPPYYPEQITSQIIDNQLEKLIFNFNKTNNENNKESKVKMNINMNYLRQLAEKQGEWIQMDYPDQTVYVGEDNDDDDENNSYDSNNENNSNNTYPEDESIENEENENSFGEEYDDYDNNEDYNNNEDYDN